jgi:long-subunit acyl-CoA synthetase (AMP-forming)
MNYLTDTTTEYGAYQWLSYRDIQQFSFRLAVGLRSYDELSRGVPGDISNVVAFCGPQSIYWLISDIASVLNGYFTVAFHCPFPKQYDRQLPLVGRFFFMLFITFIV